MSCGRKFLCSPGRPGWQLRQRIRDARGSPIFISHPVLPSIDFLRLSWLPTSSLVFQREDMAAVVTRRAVLLGCTLRRFTFSQTQLLGATTPGGFCWGLYFSTRRGLLAQHEAEEVMEPNYKFICQMGRWPFLCSHHGLGQERKCKNALLCEGWALSRSPGLVCLHVSFSRKLW